MGDVEAPLCRSSQYMWRSRGAVERAVKIRRDGEVADADLLRSLRLAGRMSRPATAAGFARRQSMRRPGTAGGGAVHLGPEWRLLKDTQKMKNMFHAKNDE